jgi:2-octaprenyl-6-methoxyphenol hydroxylase
MKVCILGGGLTSFTLAKALINMGIYVDVFFKPNKKQYKSRTLGLSKSNIEFFNKNILNINKLLWRINKIEIFSENLNNEKILNFENNDQILFSIIKNSKLNDCLLSKLEKSKFIKFKKDVHDYRLIKDKYKLIINCDIHNQITKKYFYKKFNKNYLSYAHTAIVNHKKKLNNKVATQVFTKKGPIAFLPISDNQTSIVYSVKGKKDIELLNLVQKYNTQYKIIDIKNVNSFELKSSDLRNYHYKNILAFGDLLHKIHPLAGQGFNMTIRDIKNLIKIIKKRIDLGLELDSSICSDFERYNKHNNFMFARGIDFIYEFFNFENKVNINILSKTAKFFGKNKLTNNFFTKFADHGVQFKNY